MMSAGVARGILSCEVARRVKLLPEMNPLGADSD